MLKISRKNQLLAVLCVTLFLIVNISTLKNGHNQGDDFSQYIIHARNIVEHKKYDQGIMLDNPTVYPPGYPLLIAPLVKTFGINFKILKFPNVIFWLLFVLVTYPVARRRVGEDTAVLCCCLLLSSSFFFWFKQNILSDIPFTLFLTAAIYAFIQYDDRPGGGPLSEKYFFLTAFILLACLSFLIRSTGLLLFVASIFYSAFIKRDYKITLLIIFSLGIVFWLQSRMIDVHPGFFLEILRNPLKSTLISIIHNSPVVLRSTLWLFCPAHNAFSSLVLSFIDKIFSFFIPVFTLIVLIVFIRKVKNRSLSFMGCFFFFYLAALIIWSNFTMPVDAFTRFVLPIIGFVPIFAAESMAHVGQKFINPRFKNFKSTVLIRWILAFFIFLNIADIVSIFNFNDDVIYRKECQELYAWVKKNLQPDEHFMFGKPRLLALLTDRVGTAPWSRFSQRKDWPGRIKEFNITYLITAKPEETILIGELEAHAIVVQLVWENDVFKIFKVLKAG